MNIRFLETALWLAKLKSIKATAEKLCLTQAAVSSRIANLEQDLGVCLFVRGDDGFEPTSAGMTSELTHLFLATDLTKVGDGGGTGHEDIKVHLVPRAELRDWLKKKEAEGHLIDFKIHASLWAAGL